MSASVGFGAGRGASDPCQGSDLPCARLSGGASRRRRARPGHRVSHVRALRWIVIGRPSYRRAASPGPGTDDRTLAPCPPSSAKEKPRRAAWFLIGRHGRRVERIRVIPRSPKALYLRDADRRVSRLTGRHSGGERPKPRLDRCFRSEIRPHRSGVSSPRWRPVYDS